MTQKESRSHLYMIWSSMKRRCENPNMPSPPSQARFAAKALEDLADCADEKNEE